MPTSKLLIIDDDRRLTEMLSEYLAPEGIELDAAPSGDLGLSAARSRVYDLIILDVMLPRLSGFDVLRQIRAAGLRTPVLMLTARGDDVDRIVGLEMGADDYLPKPFNPRELLARVKAILRRTAEATRDTPERLQVGRLVLDMRRRDAWCNDRSVALTNAEFVILATLMKSAGDVVSREVLTRAALGRPLLPDDRSLDTHISNLRRKLGSSEIDGPVIRSIRGSGYVLIPSADEQH
jgi:two-component system response regulator CpxR